MGRIPRGFCSILAMGGVFLGLGIAHPRADEGTVAGEGRDVRAATTAATLVQARYDATRTLDGRFVQEVSLGSSGRIVRSEGTLRFRKPGQMRWDYEAPERQTLLADGETLWIYQPEENQVIRSSLRQAFSSHTPISFLFGVARLVEDFSPELLPSTALGSIRLRLRPKVAGAGGSLVLEIDAASYDLQAAVVRDVMGNETRVALVGVQRNIALADSLFKFVRPPGTDVLQVPGGG